MEVALLAASAGSTSGGNISVHHELDDVRCWSVGDKSSCHGDNQLLPRLVKELETVVVEEEEEEAVDEFELILLLVDFFPLPLSENK